MKVTALVICAISGVYLSSMAFSQKGTIPPTLESSVPVKGQVFQSSILRIPKAMADKIPASMLAKFNAQGIDYDAKKAEFVFPRRPYVGAWIRVGKEIVMADKDGRFVIPQGTIGSQIQVVRDPMSSAYEQSIPFGAFSSSKPGQCVQDVELDVKYVQEGIDIMGVPLEYREVTGQKPDPSDEKDRCKSWDGTFTADAKTPQGSIPGIIAYINSTCWQLVDAGICRNENAVIENVFQRIKGPECKLNHGYRYCQDIDDGDFHLLVPAKVTEGEKAYFDVRNNTAVPWTSVDFTGSMDLSENPEWCGARGNKAYLRHFDPSTKSYRVLRRVNFVAKLPAGATNGSITVTISAFGQTMSRTIEVTKSSSTATPLLDAYKADMVKVKNQFKIGRTEVTVGMWKEYCAATNRIMKKTPPWGSIDDYPMVGISYVDCEKYAEWAGLRLPTGSEWELAASGGDGRNYPWGGFGPMKRDGTWPGWDPNRCICWVPSRSAPSGSQRPKPVAVGSVPAGNSPFGCADMAGNVWEWTSEVSKLYPAKREIRGGSWAKSAAGVFLCNYKVPNDQGERNSSLGVRLAADK